MRSILFVHNEAAPWVRLDLEELQKRYQVTEYYLPTPSINPARLWRQVRTHDLVFGWFASWHTFLPFAFARLLKKPSVLVVGGYDVANMPQIGYGHQRGGIKKWISRWTMKLATRLVPFSGHSECDAERNASISKSQMQKIYIGVPDPFLSLPKGQRARMALTVGNVDQPNLLRKGHEAFVRTAALMPDVSFVLAGAWRDDAVDHLRAIATPNVTLTGWLTDEALRDYYRSASVYVQVSHHEGFGLSVAEAMLAGCVPVVSNAGSLPEVTGDSAIVVDTPVPASIARAIAEALTYPEEARAPIRQRILEHFPLEKRGQSLDQLIRSLLNGAN